MTKDELLDALVEAIDDDLYFEIAPDDAKVLYDYIRMLELATEDARGIL